MVHNGPPAFVLLGRFGDIIQLLPAFKAIGDRTGAKPMVVSSTDYTSVYDGVSYVDVFPIHGNWYAQVPNARDLARDHFGAAVVLPWWHETDRAPTIASEQWGEGITVLQSHGHNWGVDMGRNPDYGTSMWWRAGFSREEMISLPLVFDRRDPVREERLAAPFLRHKRPLLLYNFNGASSPFAPVPEAMEVIHRHTNRFKLVDLGNIQAHRIYDLVGLMERAVGMVHIDSAPLHLSAATKTPYIAFTVDGWSTSVPKSNCVLEIKYSQATQRLNEVNEVIQRWAESV